MACFVGGVLWGGNTEFENTVEKLNWVFHIGSGHKHLFYYIRIKLKSYISSIINQHEYIESISPFLLSNDDYKCEKQSLETLKRTKLRGILVKLN